MNGIVIDKELSEEEVKNLKKGDILLVKLRSSNAMATGMLVSFIISSKLIYTGYNCLSVLFFLEGAY